MKECPKCGKKEISDFGAFVSGAFGEYAVYFNFESKKDLTVPPRVYGYVCMNCGYIESYVSPKELKKKSE